ncbi:MAG: response regulator, partial [Planctomycetes bacterium]|nr:response regulator [Planctomycetota bacterium]
MAKKKLLRVLLIEDELAHQELILHYLSHSYFFNHQITCCASFQETSMKIRDGAYDIVLTDLSLPDSSANETLGKLKSLGIKCPIVSLTSLDDDLVISKLIQQGASDCIPKMHLNPSLLDRTIRYSLDRHELEKEKLDRSREMKEAMFQSTRVSYLVTDLSWQFIEWNPGFEMFTGY